MGVIDEIVRKKRKRLAHAKSAAPLGELRARLSGLEAPRDFRGAVTDPSRHGPESPGAGRVRLIAELKKASPSKGLIREDFSPRDIAAIYARHADALSVLTEEDYFQGNLGYIAQAKGTSGLPVLRKDFIFDEYQIYEARAAGADAILLIENILEAPQAEDYLHLARELGMAVLLEVHDMRGLEKALSVGADIIGINNRDLATLSIDLETTFRLKEEIPADKTVVSESGITARKDILRLGEAGVDAVLIGTSFMAAGDIEKKIIEVMPERGARQADSE